MKIYITLTLLLSFTNFASAQEHLALEHAVDAALEHNHGVQISRIETEIAANRATRGYAGQLPTVDITGGLSGSYADQEVTPGSFFRNLASPQGGQSSSPPPTIRFDGVTSAQIQSAIGTQFVIYDGMKGRMRYTLLKSARELADLQYRAEMESTILDVTVIYLRGAVLQHSLQLMEEVLSQSLDRYTTMQTRREYGQANEQQALQALVDLKSDSTDYRNLKLEYENTLRDLHREIGWDRRDLMPLEGTPETAPLPGYDDLLAMMQQNNTLLSVRQKRIEQAETESRIARANTLPSLLASAQYGYSYMEASDGQFESQQEIGFSGGLSLRIPIFSGGRNRIDTQNARAAIRREQIRYQESEQQLLTEFDKLWQQLVFLEDQFTTEQDNLHVYERNYERAKESFTQGLITGVELRTAQLSLQSSKFRISETKLQLNRTKMHLLHLSGGLIVLN